MSLVVLLALTAPTGEPEFAGRPLSAWAKQLKEDDTPRRRRAAALALGQLGAANPETLPVVLAALGKAARTDGSPDVRRQAVTSVAQQKPDDSTSAVEDLTEALRVEKDITVRLELATALGRYGPPAAPAIKPLIACLPDADPKLRAAAAAALGRIGPAASESGPALIERLADPDAATKREAVDAVSRVKPVVPAMASAALTKLLVDAEPSLRRAVLESLGRLPPANDETVTAVAKELDHSDTDVRLAAVSTLARYGASGIKAAERMSKACHEDSSPRLRETAARALVNIWKNDPQRAIQLLSERLLSDATVEVRIALADLLAGYGPVAVAALPALRRAQSDADPRLRQAATNALRLVEPR